MTTKAGTLHIDLEARVARLETDMSKAARIVQRNSRRMQRSLSNLKAGFAGLAAAVGVTSFTGFIKEQLDAADAIAKVSTRLGASTEALSEYEHVAKLSGVQFNTLTMGWQRMTRRISEAAIGMGEARGALAELGLNAVELNRLQPDQQFEILADAISKVGNESDRVRLAMRLFDSEGVALIQTMKGGAEGLRLMRGEARALGKTLDGDTAQSAEAVNDAFQRIGTAMDGLKKEILVEFLPVLGAVADVLQQIFAPDAFQTAEEGEKRIARLGLQLERLQASARVQDNAAMSFLRFLGVSDDPQEIEAAIAETERKLKEARERVRALANQEAAEGQTDLVAPEPQSLASLLTQRQAEVESMADLMQSGLIPDPEPVTEGWRTLYDNLRMLEDDHLQTSRAAWDQHQAFLEMSAQDQTKTVVGELLNMTAGVAQHNKTMFRINKVAAIANAIMDAHGSASRTLDAYPYPINVGLAALSYAAGMARVQAIRSTSFAGGGGGSTPSAAGSVPTLNDTPAPAQEPQRQATNVTINLGDQQVFSQDAVRSLLDSINEALGDGARLRFA